MSSLESSFFLNYNIIMLACHFEAVKILEYLYDEVILRQKNPTEFKKELLNNRGNKGIQVVHLVAMLGNLDMLRCIHLKYHADFNERTEQGLSPLHCAA